MKEMNQGVPYPYGTPEQGSTYPGSAPFGAEPDAAPFRGMSPFYAAPPVWTAQPVPPGAAQWQGGGVPMQGPSPYAPYPPETQRAAPTPGTVPPPYAQAPAGYPAAPGAFGAYPLSAVGYYPAPAPAAAPVPAFSPYGYKRSSRLRRATSSMNLMGLLVLAQNGLSMLFGALLGVVIALCGLDFELTGISLLWLSAALVPLSTALPFAVYLFVRRKRELENSLRFEKVGLVNAFFCVLAGLSMCLLSNYPASWLQNFFGQFGYKAVQQASEASSVWEFVLDICTTAVLVPVMEEFAFRGVLFSRLRRHGFLFAAMGSSLLFALAHLDFSTVVFAFGAGLTFSFLYEKTGNLWVPVFIHGLNNGLAVFLNHIDLFFGQQGEWIGELCFLGLIVLGLLALLVLLLSGKKRRWLFGRRTVDPMAPAPLRGSETADCICRSGAFWAMVGLAMLYTVFLFFQS